MNEEKINQILRNQQTIMNGLAFMTQGGFPDVNHEFVKRFEETNYLINPPKQSSIKEKTEDTLGRKDE